MRNPTCRKETHQKRRLEPRWKTGQKKVPERRSRTAESRRGQHTRVRVSACTIAASAVHLPIPTPDTIVSG